MSELNVGSLFSGIGGIELGFEREGFTTEWFVENNEFCQKILRKHWSDVPIYGNISTLDFKKLKKVDVLTGGFPCQDISIAGKGKGITGSRSGLWSHFARAIGVLRPKYAVVENVPMLVRRGLDVVLADIAALGYDAEWFCLRASDFGALHRRERVFIVAYPDKDGKPVKPVNGGTGQGKLGGFVAHPIGERCPGGVVQRGSKGQEKDGAKVQGRSSPRFLADDWGERVQGFREESLQGEQRFSWCEDVRGVEDLSGRPNLPEPLVRGGRDGVPDRVDRTKAIGNAVVPVVAQFIARQIREWEEKAGVVK